METKSWSDRGTRGSRGSQAGNARGRPVSGSRNCRAVLKLVSVGAEMAPWAPLQ